MKKLNIFNLSSQLVLASCIAALFALPINTAKAQAADSTGPGRLLGTSPSVSDTINKVLPTPVQTVSEGALMSVINYGGSSFWCYTSGWLQITPGRAACTYTSGTSDATSNLYCGANRKFVPITFPYTPTCASDGGGAQ